MDENDLGRLFAAEDAAISDGGFSEQVMRSVARRRMVRRAIIAGASLVGGIIAALSLSGLGGVAKTFTAWFQTADTLVTQAVTTPGLAEIGPDITSSLMGGPALVVAAGLGVASLCIAAVALQER